MNRVRRTGSQFGELVVFENVQHLEQRGAAGRRRRHGDNLVTPVRARKRFANGRLVLLQILFSNEPTVRSEEHTSELQSHSDLVCRLLLEKKNKKEPPT